MLENVVTFFLPKRLRGKENTSRDLLEERRKARTTVYFIFSGNILALVMFTVRYALEGMESSKSLFLLPIAAVVNLLVLYIASRRDNLVFAAAYVVIFVTGVLFMRTLSTGGVTSSVAVWFIIIPITATITISKFAGTISALGCSLIILAIALHDKIGFEVSHLTPIPIVNGAVLIIALALIFSLTYFYEQERLKSELKISQFEKDLAQSLKLASLGSISTGLAHEINNPMTVVSGNFEILQMLLKKDVIDFDKVNRREALITKNLERIQSVVEAFRTYSKLSL